jgi:transposase
MSEVQKIVGRASAGDGYPKRYCVSKRWYTVSEIAAIVGVGRGTIYQRLLAGDKGLRLSRAPMQGSPAKHVKGR